MLFLILLFLLFNISSESASFPEIIYWLHLSLTEMVFLSHISIFFTTNVFLNYNYLSVNSDLWKQLEPSFFPGNI